MKPNIMNMYLISNFHFLISILDALCYHHPKNDHTLYSCGLNCSILSENNDFRVCVYSTSNIYGACHFMKLFIYLIVIDVSTFQKYDGIFQSYLFSFSCNNTYPCAFILLKYSNFQNCLFLIIYFIIRYDPRLFPSIFACICI